MTPPEPLRWRDCTLLVLFCLLLCSFPLFDQRTLTIHETVHCQNAREMRSDGDWIIPHYGGRVWMERPPLPFWISNGVVELFGDQPFSYRLAALLMGIPVVLMVAWMASVWYGRGIGLTAGLALATMQEFTHYATGPEADIFLCTIVTAALALFVQLEFRFRPAEGEGKSFFGKRSWLVLVFFVVLGLTNIVKGLFFGTIFVVLPVACFLLSNLDWPALKRYVWLWGWLAFVAAGAAWPVAAYLSYPDVIDFWKHDYLGRVNQGYMREPFWYYFVHLPLVVFPWTVPAFVGLWLTRRSALHKSTPERFLWCWAVLPVLFFSIPQGKHHHYLLQCMAPWAVLGAVGSARIWDIIVQRGWTPGRLSDARVALGAFCVLYLVVYWLGYGYRTHYLDRYQDDTVFVQQACARVPGEEPVLVMDDNAPLNASWLLFYVGERARLLHNVTFLLDARLTTPDVYLIARRKVEESLPKFGAYEVLLESKHSRYEETPADRYALYHLRLHDGLARQSNVRISPLQATGRAPGPFLYDLHVHSLEIPQWPTP